MYRPSTQPRLTANPASSTSQYAYQYNPQAIDDHDDDHVREEKTRDKGRENKPTYRPRALTWPFISTLIFLLLAAIALVVYVKQSKPNSDDKAIIDTRDFPRGGVLSDGLSTRIGGGEEEEEEYWRRQEASTLSMVVTTATEEVTTTPLVAAIADEGAVSSFPEDEMLTDIPTDFLTETLTLANFERQTLSLSDQTFPTLSITDTATDLFTTYDEEDINELLSPSLTPTPIGDGNDDADTPVISTSTECGPEFCTLVEVIVTEVVSTSTSTGVTMETFEITTPVSTPPVLYTRTIFTTKNITISTSVFESTIAGSGPPTTVVNSIPTTFTTLVSQPTSTTTENGAGGEKDGGFPTTTMRHNGTFSTITQPHGPPITETVITTLVPTTTVLAVEGDEDTIISITTFFLSETTESTIIVTTYPKVELDNDKPQGTRTSTELALGTSPKAATQVYINTGVTTLYRTTVIPNSRAVGGPAGVDEIVKTETGVKPDEVFTVVTTPPPQTIVTEVEGGRSAVLFKPELTPTTIVHEVEGGVSEIIRQTTIKGEGREGQPQVTTKEVETWVGAVPTTIVRERKPETVVRTVGGVSRTVVTTAEPITYTSMVGGTVTSVAVGISMVSEGRGIVVTQYAESTVGGTPTTVVSQPPPVTKVEVVDGTLTSIVTTPEPETLTSMVGGSLTTMMVVETNTGGASDIISSYTITTRFSGYLTTIVSTPSPTSFLSTVSDKLTTIISTPEPTTIVSTSSGTFYTTLVTSTALPTGRVSGNTTIVIAQRIEGFTSTEYFAGKFLPAFFAVGLSITLRIIDINAKLYQPFHVLSSSAGAYGADSLTLQYSGLTGSVMPIVTLMQGHPIPFITTLSVLLSSFLVPLSSEAVGIKLRGQCKITAIENCAGELGVSPNIALILVSVLGIIIVLMCLLLFFLRKYLTGLHSNPWSIAGMASLAANPDLRIHGPDSTALRARLAEKRFGIGTYEDSRGQDDYGIVLVDESGRQLNDQMDGGSDDGMGPDLGGETNPVTGSKKRVVPFVVLSYWWRLTFLTVVLSMVGLVLYYHLTAQKSTPLSNWIQSQHFGVRFMFAGMGVILALSFSAFFISVALISPYANMQDRAQPPDKSILLTRPTNAFFGFYRAIKRADPFLVVVAFMAMATEFLPILMANVPYSLTQTRTTHIVCTRLTMVILAADALVVAASLFRKWPHMPMDPRNIAGAMYYVVQSKMLGDFEGTSKMTRKERDIWLMEKGRRYFYGEVTGNHGGYRMAVDGDAMSGEGGLEKVKTEYRGYDGT